MRYAVYTYVDGTSWAFSTNNDGSNPQTLSGAAQPTGTVVCKVEALYQDSPEGHTAAKANTTTLGTILPA